MLAEVITPYRDFIFVVIYIMGLMSLFHFYQALGLL